MPNKMYLCLNMSVLSEVDIEEDAALLLELGVSEIEDMISRIEKVAVLRQEDPDVFSLTRHAYGLSVIDMSKVKIGGLNLYRNDNRDGKANFLTEKQFNAIMDQMEAHGSSLDPDDPGPEMSVAASMENYTYGDVYFTAFVEHTDIEIQSQSISIDVLKDFLTRLQKEEKGD